MDFYEKCVKPVNGSVRFKGGRGENRTKTSSPDEAAGDGGREEGRAIDIGRRRIFSSCHVCRGLEKVAQRKKSF